MSINPEKKDLTPQPQRIGNPAGKPKPVIDQPTRLNHTADILTKLAEGELLSNQTPLMAGSTHYRHRAAIEKTFPSEQPAPAQVPSHDLRATFDQLTEDFVNAQGNIRWMLAETLGVVGNMIKMREQQKAAEQARRDAEQRQIEQEINAAKQRERIATTRRWALRGLAALAAVATGVGGRTLTDNYQTRQEQIALGTARKANEDDKNRRKAEQEKFEQTHRLEGEGDGNENMSLVIEGGTSVLDLSLIAGEKRKKYPDGSCIYFQGDQSGLPLVIEEGAVKLSVLSPSGQEATLRIMRPPEILFDGCLSDEKRSSYAYAVGKTTVIPVSFEYLYKIPDFNVLSCLLTQTARQLRGISNFYSELATRRVRARLATFLLQEFNGQEIFATTNTQHQISTTLGATRESTNINLKRLKKAGIIDYGRLGVVTYYQMLNPEQLSEIAKPSRHSLRNRTRRKRILREDAQDGFDHTVVQNELFTP